MSVKNIGAHVDCLFSSSPWKVTVSLGGDDEGAQPLGFLASFRWQAVLGATAEIQI